MKTKLIVALLAVIPISNTVLAQAEPTSKDASFVYQGKLYRNVTFSCATADGKATFNSNELMVTLPWIAVPANVQKLFSTQYRQSLLNAFRESAAKKAELAAKYGRAIQKIGAVESNAVSVFCASTDGLVTFNTREGRATLPWDAVPLNLQTLFLRQYQDAVRLRASGLCKVSGTILQVLESSALVSRPEGDTILVKNVDTTNLVDGSNVQFMARRQGTYKYTSVLGSVSTVEAWEAGPDPKK